MQLQLPDVLCPSEAGSDPEIRKRTDGERVDPDSRRSERSRNYLAVRYRRRAADASGVRDDLEGTVLHGILHHPADKRLPYQKTADLLAKYPPRGAKITLYGSSDEVYEKVCRVKNGFTDADAGIRTLCEMKIPVRLISTVIRQNEDDIKRMAFYAYIHRLPWMATGGIKASCRGAESEARRVRVENKLEEQKREGIKRRLEKALVDINRKPCTYCKDYRLGYWVVWNGDMRFCSFMNEPNIPVRDMPFQKAWEELVRYEEALEWPEECRTCEAQKVCFKCAGTLAAECGSPHRVTEEYCGRVRKIYDEVKGE